MEIQNGYNLTIKIDDKDIFSEYPCEFLNAAIYESIENVVPTCTIDLGIGGDAFKELPFVDGSKIEINIQSDPYEVERTYNFRLYNIEKILQNTWMISIRISGILDFFEGYTPGNVFNANATTSEIFNKVASQFQLKNTIDTTNDKQLWVAGENNIYQFLSYITQYAYVDEKSAMFWCLDAEKQLLFRNLTTVFSQERNDAFTFVQGVGYDTENKIYRYVSANAHVLSGINNIRNQGYGGNDYYFNLLDYNLKEANSKFVVAENRMLNISKELSKGLANRLLPFDVGNFHENYYNAYKQNKRIMSTFSTEVILSTDCLQKFKLSEIVKLVYMDAGDIDLAVVPLSGSYIISDLNTIVSKNAIIAKLKLIGQGLNTKSKVVETY